MSKKVLLIDDLRNFKEISDSDVVLAARNSEEGVDLIRADDEWDEIWLDHDLGIVQGCKDTIMPVVDYLCERAFNDDPVKVSTVFVHTSNPVGRKQMKASLERFGYNVLLVDASMYFYA